MSSANWKDAAELAGMSAIVASLVFVGLQMRQTRDIALTENGWSVMMGAIESRRPIYEFPDIWTKGNAGDELNSSEEVIYTTLIRDFNERQFWGFNNATTLDNDYAASIASMDTAGFLYENPGARREWESLRDEFRRYRQPHISGQYRNIFEESVRAHLDVLDKLHDP